MDGSTFGELTIVLGPIVVVWILAIAFAFGNTIIAVLISSLGGLALSGYLSWQHLSKSDSAACNIGEMFSCSAVNTSEYGVLSGHLSFLPNVPLAFLGFAFYGSILVLAVNVWSESNNSEGESRFSHFGSTLGVFSGIALLLSFYLAYISGVEIGAWCLYCIGMYGCNAILFLCGVLWQWDVPKGKDISIQTFLTPFAILTVISVFFSSTAQETIVSKGNWSIEKVEPEGTIFDGSEPIFGMRSAPYTLLEFADFQCPHCAQMTPDIKKLVSEYSHVIHLKYKHFPLSNICNPSIKSLFHKQACQAAYAADCAGKQGKFWDMSKLIFVNGSHLEDKSYPFLAKQIRINVDLFSACMKEPSTKKGISSDIQAAESFGITGTPALYLHDGETWWKIQNQDVGLEETLLLLAKGETPPGANKENPIQAKEKSSQPSDGKK